MANSKISGLTGATTPLVGTETLPVVQSGVTKQVSVANLTAGRAVSVASLAATGAVRIGTSGPYSVGSVYSDASWGMLFTSAVSGPAAEFAWLNYAGSELARITSTNDYRLTVGNFVPATAAKGINFTANTPAAGMTSQLLNWYEEGTWTPTQGANLIVVGAFSSSGTYKRVGKIVFVTGTLSGVTSIAWNSSASEVCAGLPFVSALNATGTAFNQSFNASATLVSNSSSLLAAEALGATPAAKFSITYSV